MVIKDLHAIVVFLLEKGPENLHYIQFFLILLSNKLLPIQNAVEF